MTTTTAPLLRIRGLRKEYGGRPVLRSIDLDVSEHQVVCLIGGSGSGKSTLLRCVDLLDEVDDGTVHLGDTELTDPRLDPDRARRRIGIVFQAYNLFPHLTVLDNITLAPRKVHGVKRREAETHARELLARLGLSDKAGDYPDRLSGGQQQRAAIARALATEPELLLFDEITSALDPELVGEVLDVVTDLKQRGLTILMATHEMGFARHAADRVCYLEDGVIREQGPAEQVLTDPRHESTRRFLARVLDRKEI
ncbi:MULTISPECIES: amino acid ABC transporter ATP-binding protein [Kitasatospora]|uniref:Putative amino acid ABC transporter ATP-binding protein n=1 Tax=Kitasatospora setae (strain ATCC 33774 / DSM 43861 / JCM 3304 / KCC A-0304 / NBRC 14216 / KM-6054) TaxID=452652 RepID=E4N7D7_KITSK|nr:MULTISPECIES: amino acid ABC transporter ATP-binding protein [Kitasatospora]BAJ27118.1 putative amino acid ABC transporter ATP-binding protein [Kitasatospora setae KM-6054]